MRGNTSTISLTEFRAEWLSHVPMRMLCERYTITRDQVIRLKHVWQLPPRHDRSLRAKPKRQRDPTTTEIQQACLRIQSQWTDEVRELRKVTKTAMVHLKRLPICEELGDEWHDDDATE